MIKQAKKYLVLLTVLQTLCGCSAILSKIYGVRYIKKFDLVKYDQFIAKIDTSGISLHHFYADTASYKCMARLVKSASARKSLKQPVQLLYFINDTLISYHANCYAPGTERGLNWNYGGRFGVFPPRSAVPADSMRLNLESSLSCYPRGRLNDDKCVLIIYWTRMFERISKKAIDTALENVRKFNKNKEVVIYLVNNDQSFLGK